MAQLRKPLITKQYRSSHGFRSLWKMKTESCISAANNTKILFLNKAENLRKVSVSLRYCSCTQGHFQLMLVSKGVSLTTVR